MSRLSPQEIDRDLAFAVDAARRAGERVMGLRESGRWEGKQLADIGDQAADGYLQGLILGRYPEDGLLSEETVDSPERLERARTWIVDPLDGTKEFSQLREDWAVHVALAVDGRCGLGAVSLPAQGKLLWGVALEGQQRSGVEDLGGGAAAPLVPGSSEASGGPRVVVSRSHRPEWVDRFGEALGAASLEGMGSVGHKVGQLLLGEADVYVHKIGLKEWDTCAPECVARSLGWAVCKLRGEDHGYNQPNPKNHELVVCRPDLREKVLEALASSGALD